LQLSKQVNKWAAETKKINETDIHSGQRGSSMNKHIAAVLSVFMLAVPVQAEDNPTRNEFYDGDKPIYVLTQFTDLCRAKLN